MQLLSGPLTERGLPRNRRVFIRGRAKKQARGIQAWMPGLAYASLAIEETDATVWITNRNAPVWVPDSRS